jgi:hypothetical protein
MPEVTIYGASDDLIEVEGDIREEYYARDAGDMANAVVFPDGSVVAIEYTPAGVWRIGLERQGAGTTVEHVRAPEDDDDNYSDRVTLKSDQPFRWAVHCLVEVE